MKKPHIYSEDGKITCSLCGDSEILVGDDGFKQFKVHAIHNKNIVSPSTSNPDLEFWAECPTCKRQTGIHLGPYLYY